MDYEILYRSGQKHILLEFQGAAWPPRSGAVQELEVEYDRAAELLIVNTDVDMLNYRSDGVEWLKQKGTVIHGDLREYVRHLRFIKATCDMIATRDADVVAFEDDLLNV